jgi:hypothetical protein
MKTLVATVAFAIAFTAVPIFIQSAAAAESMEVYVGGKYIGQDPDPNIRLQLRRDAGSENSP